MERRRTYPVSIRITSGQVERVSENWTNHPAVQKRRQREHWELQRLMPTADDKQNSGQSSREATSRMD